MKPGPAFSGGTVWTTRSYALLRYYMQPIRQRGWEREASRGPPSMRQTPWPARSAFPTSCETRRTSPASLKPSMSTSRRKGWCRHRLLWTRWYNTRWLTTSCTTQSHTVLFRIVSRLRCGRGCTSAWTACGNRCRNTTRNARDGTRPHAAPPVCRTDQGKNGTMRAGGF